MKNINDLEFGLSEAQLLELCYVSYDNDFDMMNEHYEYALKKAHRKCNLKQVQIFTRELHSIEKIIERRENDKGL